MLKPEYTQAFQDIVAIEKAALPLKTMKFWKLARCWNGLDNDPNMTVSSAFESIRGIQSELNPSRPLNSGLENLKESIVQHGTKAQERKYTTKNSLRARIVVL